MPDYKITAPDGNTYQVTAPEDATQDQVLQYAQANYQHPAVQSGDGLTHSDTTATTAAPTETSTDPNRLPGVLGDINDFGNDLGRAAVMTGRSVVQGALGIPALLHDALVMTPYNAIAKAAGSDSRINPGSQQLDSYMNAVGIPNPQPANATERYASAIDRGLGGVIGGAGIGNIASTSPNLVTQGVGNTLTNNIGAQAASAATGATSAQLAHDAGAGPVGQTVAGLVGGLVPSVPAMTKIATQVAMRGGEAGRQQVANNISDFANAGTTPTVGQATQNARTQGMESLLAKTPGAVNVMKGAAQRQADQVSGGLDNLANGLSPGADSGAAGNAIIQGVGGPGGFVERFKQASSNLYNNLDKYIPQNTPIDISKTKQALADINAGITNAPQTSALMQNPKLVQLERAINSDANSQDQMMNLYHGGGDDLTNINGGSGPGNIFGGIFASNNKQSALSHGSSLYNVQVPSSKVLTQDILDSGIPENDLYKLIRKSVIDDDSNSVDPEDLMRVFREENPSEASWEAQRIRGDVAKNLGYQAVQMNDEHGISYLVLPGVPVKKVSPQQYDDSSNNYTNGNLPYAAVKHIRSMIGDQLSDFQLTSDVPRSKLNALYGALSDDMKQAAQNSGPQAQAAWNKANEFYKSGQDRIDTLQRVVNQNGGPEAVFNSAMAGTKDGATTLNSVMNSLSPADQKMVSAAVINRLGKATPGQQNAAGDEFSMGSFLTNWNKLSPQAKSTLFDRYGPSFSKDMDSIANVASNVRSGSRYLANPSGTAASAAQIGTVGAFITSALTGHPLGAGAIAAGTGVANLGARLMTNPTFVKFLAKKVDVPIQGLVPTISALQTTAREKKDPDIKAAADILTQSAQQANP